MKRPPEIRLASYGRRWMTKVHFFPLLEMGLGIQKDKYAYNSYLKKLQQFNYDKDYINTVKREMEYRFHEA